MAMCKVSSSALFVKGTGPDMRSGTARNTWQPNTDVYQTDNGLVVKVELAGMRSDNLELTVEGNRLRISGNRPDGCRAAKCSFLVMEINYGPFETVLDLPAGRVSMFTTLTTFGTPRDITLEELSRVSGYSAFHLQRMFKKALGISPRQYAAGHRLQDRRRVQVLDDPADPRGEKRVGIRAVAIIHKFILTNMTADSA